ncbi:hypothetical protein E4T56_gene7197 [Termitomyces sp. T112]|nr:hypothetical protein E4T56_gene7197 [Termitomyces sp. T112]
MRQAQTFDFLFKNVENQFESYQGIDVKLRYHIRDSISRRMAVYTLNSSTTNLNTTSRKDVIVGKFYFLLLS